MDVMIDNAAVQVDFRRILDSLADAVVAADRSGRIIYANAAVERLLDWPPADLVGQPIALLIPPRLRAAHTAGFRRYVTTGVARLIGHPARVSALHRDGGEVDITLTLAAFPLSEGEEVIVASLHDLSDSTAIEAPEQRFRSQVDFTDAITKSLGEGVYVLDAEGRVTFMNPAAERMLGWTEEEVLGRNMHETIHFQREDGTRVPEEECPLLQVVRSGLVYRADDDVFTRRDGTLLPVRYTSAPIVTAGKVMGTVLSFQDMSEQREVERQKDHVLSAVAHDLKSPLTSIKGFAQLLLRRARKGARLDDQQMLEGLETIASTAVRMARLIDELLDVARVRMGRPLELTLQPVDLVALARRVVTEQQKSTEIHHLEARSEVPEMIGRWDPGRLERVLTNLISNAIKYSPSGGKIVVAIGREDARAVLSVQDGGIGIPAEDLPHVFERFRRGRNAGRDVPGSGIGLATACQIVEQHGGTIDVESREGRGSAFIVRLPLAGPDEAA